MQQARKQESLAALASGIANDFNQLVGQILDNAAVARAARAPTPAGRELLENIERAARRAADLTNQMLVYAGEVRFQECALFLNHLIDDMAHVLEAMVPENAALRCVHDPEPLPVMADPAQLRQIIVNLTTNAAEALGEAGGTITISTGATQLDREDLAGTRRSVRVPAGERHRVGDESS
jgi:signal transduction histidine kinase